jgi:hypothetical protein
MSKAQRFFITKKGQEMLKDLSPRDSEESPDPHNHSFDSNDSYKIVKN